MEAIDFNMHRHYANHAAKQDESPDLGYRWLSGEVDDLEVLAECLGLTLDQAHQYIYCYEGSGEVFDARHTWREAGETFDWILGIREKPPTKVQYELNKL